MPSPFPGMDPYLESQGRWPDLHARIIAGAGDALGMTLPENYAAQINEAMHFVTWEPDEARKFYPDVALTRGGERPARGLEPDRRGGVAVLEAGLEPVEVALGPRPQQEVRHTWIEILRLPDQRLVTVIELLSPTNKGSSGRAMYLEKRERLLGQDVHLVEIDLLLDGQRLPMGDPLPPGDYYALVSRSGRRPMSDVYAWSIRRRLPRLPVPLLAPDPDAVLPLADLFANAYERGRYGRLIDYAAPLSVPLGPEDRAWAEGIARGVQAR